MHDIIISLDETYHLKNNKPLYKQTFDKVQSFHFPPAYAPVINNEHSFFIDTSGQPVFERSFKQAFGFYCGIATVEDEQGFFHIDEQGKDIHCQRFYWAGNFQENICVVQDKETRLFFHINSQAQPIYKKQYAYVGDYCYGIAVITNEKGLCTHIDKQGQLLHQKYFLECDVYHKGYAIVKDERGYFHINKKGQALYNQRYLKLEPFYNNRAVAIDVYGVKKIISITGDIIQIIEPLNIETQKIVSYYADQSFSYWSARILHSILELGVFDLLKSNISISTNELYHQLDLPEKSIDMIMRWLQVQQLIINKAETYSLTLAGKTIIKTLKPVISYWQSPELIQTSLALTASLKKHQKSFDKLYSQPFFEYTQMNKQLNQNLAYIMDYYADDYRCYFPYLNLSNEVVCDIGGGNGALLTTLKKSYPKISPLILDKFNYANPSSIEQIAVDIFQKWSVSADVYLVSRILHDWNDEKVTQLLEQIAQNMQDKTILYLFETLIDKNNVIDNGVTVSFHLLNLLGGRERTLSEFSLLLYQFV